MPWGWECRSKLLKQIPPKPAERKTPLKGNVEMPGPSHYDPPEIFCGRGFSKIKRAPAYTFGQRTPVCICKPAATARAPMFNIQGMQRKGRYRIKHGVITPHLELPTDKLKVPGPGAYAPRLAMRVKRPPAYSIQPPPRPPFQPFDMWTPSPNMYCPPIPAKTAPAYSLNNGWKQLPPAFIPGPGEHDPNFNFVKKAKPAFSFGYPFREMGTRLKTPAPNTYCEKKYNYPQRWPPAPSFGIRHTEYLGQYDVYERSNKLDLLADD